MWLEQLGRLDKLFIKRFLFVPIRLCEEPPILTEWVSDNGGIMVRKFKYKNKNYAHFDKKIPVCDAKNYVKNPEKVAKHSFYPFICYVKRNIKYSATGGKKNKPRKLCYAAHMDSYIYQLYGYKLNNLYNTKTKNMGINKCSIAYRNNTHTRMGLFSSLHNIMKVIAKN